MITTWVSPTADDRENDLRNWLAATSYQIPPPTLTSFVLVYGSMFDETGNKLCQGKLTITPYSFMRLEGNIVVPSPIYVNIPSTGNFSFYLAPSNGIQYKAEYDPDPSNPAPPPLKSGYFVEDWTIPSTGPVDIATL